MSKSCFRTVSRKSTVSLGSKSGNGHGLGIFYFLEGEEVWSRGNYPDDREYAKALVEEVEARLGRVRARKIRPNHGTVFPNLSVLPNGTLRIWHPRGPEKDGDLGMDLCR